MTQWQQPRDEHRNGQVLGYILRYRLHGYNNAPWSNRNISNEVRPATDWEGYETVLNF